MLGLGAGEMFVILLIALVIFGGSKLPELGRGLGEGIRSFRDALRDDKPADPAPPPAATPKPDELPPR
jgi:sec-independent protein translocase protein TatA